MAELTVDLTYGSALYQAAVEVNKKDLILEEATQVLDVFEKEPEFYEFINYPAISAKEKKEVLAKVFEGRICQELLNLLYVLVDKGRTARYAKIVKAYKDMVDREEGVTYGTVYSVEPLTETQIKKMEEQITDLIKQKTRLENKLDASLIGGIKVLVDGRIIDASIKKRLQDLSSQLI
jgi:ATP synthase F1 delta subunit